MDVATRLGFAGLVLAFFSIAAPILWPDKKWIGWVSLAFAVALLLIWGWYEARSTYQLYPARTAFFVFVGGGGVIVALFLLRANTFPQGTPASFSVDVRSALVSDAGPRTLFMVGYPSSLGKTVSPVFYLAYLQFVNNRDYPVTINSLAIAASKESDGPFEDLVAIPISRYTLYNLGVPAPSPKQLGMGHGTYRLATAMTEENMKHAAIVRAWPTVDAFIGTPIPPRTPARGWIGLASCATWGYHRGRSSSEYELSIQTGTKRIT